MFPHSHSHWAEKQGRNYVEGEKCILGLPWLTNSVINTGKPIFGMVNAPEPMLHSEFLHMPSACQTR